MIRTRGSEKGECNICGDFGKLTEDHTPPKGCYKPGAVELLSIVHHLQAELPKKKGRISQNGVKYKTLCSRCNNQILGIECDPELIYFVNGISSILRSPLSLPKIITCEAKPQKIMKSVIGHLCAQGVNRYKKGQITEPIKKYFLEQEESLPENINIYCWPFPYARQIMSRDSVLRDLRASDPVSFWLLKFFPAAFLVTFDEPEGYKFPGLKFSNWRSAKYEETVRLPFAFSPVPHQYWPEAPDQHSFVMYGNEAIVSIAKRS